MVKNVKDILLDDFWIMPATPEYIEVGVPYITSKNIKNGKIDFSKVNYISQEAYETISKNRPILVGDILISMIGTLGETAEVTLEDGSFYGQNMFLIRLDEMVVYKRYFLNYFKSDLVKRALEGKQNQSTQKYLKANHIEELQIPILPLDEQISIAETLDKIQGIISRRKDELLKLDELIKARFIELFGSMESKIPISEMCNVTGGYSFKSGDISDDGAIKILQIGNVHLDNVSWETTNYLPEGFDEKYSKFMLDEGDIVVALTRPIIQSLGNVKACIVKSSDLPCLLNQRVGRIVAKKEKSVFLEFIYGCLMTDDFTRYVESCSIGCSQPNISTKDIENYLIPNATYEKQKAYVEFKKETDKSKVAVQKALDEAQLLFDSLMQKYFG